MVRQPGLFDLDERYRRLSETGDPLVKLSRIVDFEIFRARLNGALKRSDGSRGGRPPYDPVLMFKILVPQTLYALSDDATEFQIRDQLSFMRFLRLGLEDPVPDAKTVWLFSEMRTRAGAISELFADFDAWLKGQGYLAMSGQIVDASIIAAPRQRNTDAEKAALKEGRIPDDWTDKPAKLAQKDRDARWTLKRAKARKAKDDGTKAKVEIAIPVFGYKNHVSIDRAHGLIRRFAVTDAAAHDGARLAAVLDKTNTASDVWADTAYRSAANEAHLARHGFRSKVHFRRKPGFDLTPSQRKANRARSAVRSAVETVFAAEKHVFGLVVRTIGIARPTPRSASPTSPTTSAASSGSRGGPCPHEGQSPDKGHPTSPHGSGQSLPRGPGREAVGGDPCRLSSGRNGVLRGVRSPELTGDVELRQFPLPSAKAAVYDG